MQYIQKVSVWRHLSIMSLAIILVVADGPTIAVATTATSPNYQIIETQFGVGSNLESCSDQYCARATIGDMGVGESQSGAQRVEFGSIAQDSDPMLEVIVDPGISNLGILSPEKTATKTTTVRIRNYLSEGYTLHIMGAPPKYKNHTLKTPSTPTASAQGTEQFAINAASNTTPNVGTGPIQVPSGQTSFGVVNDDYKTANLFKYVSGDTIAHSNSSSGRTDYTISMIVNVSNATPAGHFSGDFSAVVIPVY